MMEAQSILFSTAQLAMEVVEKEVRIESRALHTFFSGGEGRGIKKVKLCLHELFTRGNS